jgi:DNA invertase Pin-like site-specific DNA recombinase
MSEARYYPFPATNKIKDLAEMLSPFIFIVDILLTVFENILSFKSDNRQFVLLDLYNYRLGADIQSKVLAFAFGLAAEIERNLISQRTKEALARIKADGKHLGRPHGFKKMKRKLDGKNKQLISLLEKNVPKTQIVKMLGIERSLIYTFLKVHNLPEYINKKQ